MDPSLLSLPPSFFMDLAGVPTTAEAATSEAQSVPAPTPSHEISATMSKAAASSSNDAAAAATPNEQAVPADAVAKSPEAVAEKSTSPSKNSPRNNNGPTNPNDRKHVCPVEGCGKAYLYKHHLKQHLKLHDELRPELCVICGARFPKKSSLRIHISQTHAKHPEKDGTTPEAVEAILKCKPYVCNIDDCKKAFPTEGQLQKHLKKHEEKRHVCAREGCGKAFTFRKDLLKHIKIDHPVTAESLICQVCQKSFKNKQTLDAHVRNIHKKSPQEHKCPYDGCTKVYTKKGNLDQHIKSAHLREESGIWVCNLCDDHTSYATKYILKRHYKNVHEMDDAFINAEIQKLEVTKMERSQQEPLAADEDTSPTGSGSTSKSNTGDAEHDLSDAEEENYDDEEEERPKKKRRTSRKGKGPSLSSILGEKVASV